MIDAIGREYQLVRVDADGFAKLSPRDQALAYYLYRAGLPGRETFFALNHRHAPGIKSLLETVLTPIFEQETFKVDPAVLKKIKEYAGIFFINSCQYNVRSKIKYTLELGKTPAESQKIFTNVLATVLGVTDGKLPENYMNQLNEVSRSMFDANFEPSLFTNDSSRDFIGESHINFYDPGVTTKDVTTKDASGKPLANQFNQVVNSRIKKTSTGTVEQVFSIEIPKDPQPGREFGLFHDELKNSVYWLGLAKEHTGSKQQRQTLGHYIDFLTTGDEKEFWDANRSWLKDHDFTVDFTFGWIEQYLDPLGVKGAWQTSVAYIDPDMNKIMEGLAKKKAYFEEKMPWDDVYKIRGGKIAPPKVDVHMLIHQDGFLQGMSIAGINLPNNEEIRKTEGAKNMILQNNSEAYDRAKSVDYEQEFLTPEYLRLVDKWGSQPSRLLTALHEVIGHGSGKMRDGQTYSDLGTHYGALEENRADLSAIFNSADPEIYRMKLVTLSEPNKSEDAGYVAQELRELQYAILLKKIYGAFLALRSTKSDSINQEHQQGHTMTLNWLRWGTKPLFDWGNTADATETSHQNLQWLKTRMAAQNLEPKKNFAVEIRAGIGKNADKHFVAIQDRNQAVAGANLLLGLLQMAKGSGDRSLVDALFNIYVNSEQALVEFFGQKGKDGKRRGGYRDELVKRATNLDIQNYSTYVGPTLIPVKDKSNKIVRVDLAYPKNLDDFLKQQVEYAKLSRATE
jgi:dipeptidyl-peptidase-3